MTKLRQRETWSILVGLAGFASCCVAGLSGLATVDPYVLGTLTAGALGLSGVGGWAQVRRADARVGELQVASDKKAPLGFETEPVSNTEVPYDEDFGPDDLGDPR